MVPKTKAWNKAVDAIAMETLAGLMLPCAALSGSSFDEARAQNGSICLESFSLTQYPFGIFIAQLIFMCSFSMNLLSHACQVTMSQPCAVCHATNGPI